MPTPLERVRRPGLRDSPPPVDVHDAVLLDLDGTLYRGTRAVPGAAAALAAVTAAGLHLAYLTNNASRTPQEVAEHLQGLGVPAAADDVVTSAQAAARLLVEEAGAGARVLVVGGHGLREALRQVGLVPVDSADHDPVAVVQGFAPDVGWPALAEGAYAVGRGLPWIATNGDRTLPLPRGLAPGNGALVEVIRAATGARPRVAGKPEPALVHEALRRTGARRPVVVGDRLDTDVECAVRAGVPSLLVLTGVATPRDLLAAPPQQRPTHVSADLGGLLLPHPATCRDPGGGWRCGRWRASTAGGRLVVAADPGAVGGPAAAADDGLDALRAACAAVWSSTDAGEPVAFDDLTGVVG